MADGNEVSRRKSAAKAKLKATSLEERIQLQKQPPKATHEPITKIKSNQLDIKLGQFTQKELDSVLRKIKTGKPTMVDEISTEVWKTKECDDILL